jgi:hypothetical protein
MKIIYPNDTGIAVIVPAPGFTAEECLGSVPTGSPYLIVEDDVIPSDRTFRGAWTADFSNAEVQEADNGNHA